MTILDRINMYIIWLILFLMTYQSYGFEQSFNQSNKQINELKGDIQTLSSIIKYQQSDIKMLKRKVSKF